MLTQWLYDIDIENYCQDISDKIKPQGIMRPYKE
jgi:hypothetical protein